MVGPRQHDVGTALLFVTRFDVSRGCAVEDEKDRTLEVLSHCQKNQLVKYRIASTLNLTNLFQNL